MNKLWSVWDATLRFGRKLKLVNSEPYSDRFNYTMMALWTVSTAMCGVNLALNLLMISRPMSPLWLTINCITGAFDGMMLYWCIQGFFYRREERRKQADLHQFIEIMVNGFTR